MTRLAGPLPRWIAELTHAELLEARAAARAAINAAYWTFTRSARGRPVPAELCMREAWLVEGIHRDRAVARAARFQEVA